MRKLILIPIIITISVFLAFGFSPPQASTLYVDYFRIYANQWTEVR